MSSKNPFASPNVVDAEEPTLPLQHGFFAQVVFGLWAGILFGGSFGAGGSVVLGLTTAAVVGWQVLNVQSIDQFLVTEIVAAIAGAICGLIPGSLIGPIVAAASYVTRRPSHRLVLTLSVLMSSAAGTTVGFLASRVLSQSSNVNTALMAVSILIGFASGALGGLALGRGILDFANMASEDSESL